MTRVCCSVKGCYFLTGELLNTSQHVGNLLFIARLSDPDSNGLCFGGVSMHQSLVSRLPAAHQPPEQETLNKMNNRTTCSSKVINIRTAYL